MTAHADSQKEHKPSARTAAWEWLVAAFGAALAVAAIGWLVWEGIATRSGPPDIAVTVRQVTPTTAGWLVQFEAGNSGGTTAGETRILGTLRDGERVVETAEARLDYVPANSRRKGGLIFRNDPARHTLTLHPSGYADP